MTLCADVVYAGLVHTCRVQSMTPYKYMIELVCVELVLFFLSAPAATLMDRPSSPSVGLSFCQVLLRAADQHAQG